MAKPAAPSIVADGHRRLRPRSPGSQKRFEELSRWLAQATGWRRWLLALRIEFERGWGWIGRDGPPQALHFTLRRS